MNFFGDHLSLVQQHLFDLRSPNAATVGTATQALLSLSAHQPHHQAFIAHHNGIPLLVALMNDKRSVVVSQNAVAVLKNFVWASTYNVLIAKAIAQTEEGLSPLVALLFNPVTHTHAATILWRLSEDTQTHPSIVAAGGIQHFVRLLSDTTWSRRAAHVLSKFLWNPLYRLLMATTFAQSQTGMQPLVTLLFDPVAHTHAATVFWRLPEDVQTHPSIVAAGGIPCFVRLLSDATWFRHAASILSKLLYNQNYITSIATALAQVQRGIQPLVMLLFDPVAHTHAAAVLWRLPEDIQTHPSIIAAGGIPCFVRLLSDTTWFRHAASILSKFVWNQNYRISIAMALAQIQNSIQPLATLLLDPLAHVHASVILWSLPEDTQSHPWIVKVGGIECFVSLLSSTNANWYKKAATALNQLSRDDSAQERIAEAGGIKSLVPLLNDTDPQIVLNATATLRNLSQHDQHKKKIADEPGSLVSLAGLLDRRASTNTNLWVYQHTVEILKNLSEHIEHRYQIGNIPNIKRRLLTLFQDGKTRTNIVKILLALVNVLAWDDEDLKNLRQCAKRERNPETKRHLDSLLTRIKKQSEPVSLNEDRVMEDLALRRLLR